MVNIHVLKTSSSIPFTRSGMLSEPECRVLSSAFDTMAKDFDPKDAVIFLESSGLITADLAEKIEARPTRLERLRELLRIYRRRATDCELLISYFDFAGQEHIANLLRTDLEHVLDSCERNKVPHFPHHVRLRKLLAGGVPRVWQHVRREQLQKDVAKVLRERADLDSFIVVLHGIAGCGKSSLAAAVIADVPDLLGGCFESVVWLQDSRTKPDRIHMLFTDLLLMLWNDATSNPPKLDDVSSVYLCKQIQEALIDNPNVLVILDDVVLEETVKWVNQLGLRVLATSRNAELFAAASCSVDVIHVSGFASSEATELFSIDGTPLQGKENEIQSAINAAFAVSSGNVALLSMLKKAASGRADRLSTFSRRLDGRGLSSLTLKTSYEYASMHMALTTSVERLSSDERDTLACAAILPSEEDIPLEVWALVVPVDVVDADEAEFLMLLSDRLSKICSNGDWLSHNSQNGTFRISKMVEIYLREALDPHTIQTLTSILKYRLEKYQQDSLGSSPVREFFTKHASFYKTMELYKTRLLVNFVQTIICSVRFCVTILVACTFAMAQLLLSIPVKAELSSYNPLLWLVILYITMCYQWNRLYGAYLSRKQRTSFDEWNIMETYQPRALTMGHLFDPEPPTPFPGDNASTGEQDQFHALRDAHYANEFTYAERMAAEAKAADALQSGQATKQASQDSSSPEVVRIELKPETKDDQDSYREI
ncbi:NB-ARC domain protein [Cooperia oncophora]